MSQSQLLDIPDLLSRPSWKVGEIIRHKATGHPYRVIHIYKYYGTILIDMFDRSSLVGALNLKPAGYDDYAPDKQMIHTEGSNWQYSPVTI